MRSRFVRFNLVGIAGFGLQLAVLLALEAMKVPIAIAATIAVEAAILHNFAWHERWTWAGVAGGTRAGRLGRFHVSNGLISLVGNAAFTTALTNVGVPTIAANVTAVLACALLNFVSAHLWVISHPVAQRARGGDPGCAKTWPTFHGHVHQAHYGICRALPLSSDSDPVCSTACFAEAPGGGWSSERARHSNR